MFIDEEEAARRLRTDENLLNRILPRDPSPEPSFIFPLGLEEIIQSDPEPVEVEKKGSPKNFENLDSKEASKKLEKLLSPPSEYKGRGTKQLHRDVQAGIGLTASYLGTTKASRAGDVAISSAHSYERGYTGPVDLVNPEKSPKEDLRERIIQGHGIIVDKCFDRLLHTLNLLDDDKLGAVKKASELTVIARNLSGIISHAAQATQEKGFEVNENSVHFHVMRPEQAIEAEYKTVEVSSTSSGERE